MKRILVVVCIALAVTACSEKKEKVIDIHDLLPNTEEEGGDSDSAVTNETDSLIERFVIPYPEVKDVQYASTKHFIDRFGFKMTSNFRLISDADTVIYREWIFKDSSYTKSAFFNWLDHEAKGENVVVGTPFRLNDRSFEMFVSDTTLIFVEGPIDLKSWENYLIPYQENDWKYVLKQQGRTKARWYRLEGDRLEQIK